MTLPRTIVLCCMIAFANRVEAGGPINAVHVNFERNHVSVQTFDRVNGRPAAVGGNSGDMNSLTSTEWGVAAGYLYLTECSPCGCQVTLTVISFTVDAHQNTTVYMPSDATPLMKAHEQGHYDLNVYAYRVAAQRADVFGWRMLNRRFQAATLDEAQQQVQDCFDREFRQPYAHWRDELHAVYNRLDNNGQPNGLAPKEATRRVIAGKW